MRLTFLFLFFGFGTLQAQKFNADYMLGLNLCQIDGDRLSGYNKFGLHTGLGISRELREDLDFRLEFLLSIKGAKRQIDSSNMGATDIINKQSIRYFEIPLLLAYKKDHFGVEGGISMGVMLNGFIWDYTGRYPVGNTIKRFEFAGHLGATYQLTEEWTAYTRFSYSLNAVSPGPSGSLWMNPKIRPGYFHNVITVGIRKQLGK